jgi:hypothetical protein
MDESRLRIDEEVQATVDSVQQQDKGPVVKMGVVSFGDQEEAPASFSAAAVFSTSIIVQDITPSKTRGPPLDVQMHLLA